MDGNFYTIWPYMRLNADGKFLAIANPNLIRAGETLYHIPTFLEFYKKNSLPPLPRSAAEAAERRGAPQGHGELSVA